MKKISIYITVLSVVLMSCERIPTGVSGKENGYDYVDMGTSVMWATCNVGASVVGEYGDRIAWGELHPKENYTSITYKWCDGDHITFNKYVLSHENGTKIDNLTTLELEDDAAHVRWGGTWRMPTANEMQELMDKCDFEYAHTTQGKGIIVTAKNGNSIFFPLSKVFSDGVRSGYYWTSSLTSKTLSAYAMRLRDDNENRQELIEVIRSEGCNIRPVCVPKSE